METVFSENQQNQQKIQEVTPTPTAENCDYQVNFGEQEAPQNEIQEHAPQSVEMIQPQQESLDQSKIAAEAPLDVQQQDFTDETVHDQQVPQSSIVGLDCPDLSICQMPVLEEEPKRPSYAVEQQDDNHQRISELELEKIPQANLELEKLPQVDDMLHVQCTADNFSNVHESGTTMTEAGQQQNVLSVQQLIDPNGVVTAEIEQRMDNMNIQMVDVDAIDHQATHPTNYASGSTTASHDNDNQHANQNVNQMQIDEDDVVEVDKISPPETFDEFCRRRFLEIISERPELQENKDAVAKMLTDEWSLLNQQKECVAQDLAQQTEITQQQQQQQIINPESAQFVSDMGDCELAEEFKKVHMMISQSNALQTPRAFFDPKSGRPKKKVTWVLNLCKRVQNRACQEFEHILEGLNEPYCESMEGTTETTSSLV